MRASILRQARLAGQAISHTRPSPIASQSHSLPATFSAPVRSRIATRWYSDEKAKDESLGASGNTGEEPTVQGGSQGAADAAANPLQKDLDAAKKDVIDLKDKYVRQVAEYRNLQERTRREVQAAKDFALQRFAKDLIESIDTFDLALGAVPAEKIAKAAEGADDVNKDLRELHGGLKMTETVLMNTLKKHGLERFDPSAAGEKFNPNIHEAVFQTPQPDKEDGSCFYTTQKGFTLNGRVLRAAKVGVVKNS